MLASSSRGQPAPGALDGPAETYPLEPPDTFEAGWSAERAVRHILGPEYDVRVLGPYIDPHQRQQDGRGVVQLGGKSHVIAFPELLTSWFEDLDEKRLAALTLLADLGVERIEVLRDLARKEMERRIVRRTWQRARRVALAAVVGSFAAAHWGAEQIAWIAEKAPVLKEALQWLLGLLK